MEEGRICRHLDLRLFLLMYPMKTTPHYFLHKAEA
jgi:hypothetical protein